MTPSSPVTCSSSLDLATSSLGEPFRTSRGPRPLAAQPGRVAISTRSHALYDRCATETGVREASPMASKPAGQRAMRLLEGPASGRLIADQLESAEFKRLGRVSAGRRSDGGPGRT